MKKREIIKKIVSMLMIFALVVPIASQAYAADPTRGVEVNADHSKLDQAVQEAKDSGVDVSKEATQDKGTASSNSEADAKLAEVKADYENQIQKIKAAKLKMDDYIAKKKEYDKLKKKYDEELAKYKIAKEKYDKELEEYNKAVEEWKKHKDEDGYLPEQHAQTLIFKSEPNAKLEFVGDKPFSKEEWNNYFTNVIKPKIDKHPANGYNDFISTEPHVNPPEKERTVLRKGIPLTVRYTNLQNSYFKGKKISKVEYTYTLKETGIPGLNDMLAAIHRDPTVTIYYFSFYKNASINMTAKFFDENGEEMDMTGALVSFASLNRGTGKPSEAPIVANKPTTEKVLSFNGKFLPINGSSITVQGESAYSLNDNESKSKGSKFDAAEWDTEKSPYKWYGAIVGEVTKSRINLTFGAEGRAIPWFAFNSDVKANGVPIKPVEPTPPTAPEEPQKPETNVSYHYDVFYVKSQVEKKVTNASNQDINNKVVDTGSVVNFELKASDFPKHHEEIKSLVFTDTLPEYYKLDLEGTRANSPDYDVEYTEGTRLLKFTAKTSLLEKINKDLTKDAKVPSPKITGKVTKEGTKYENKFKISINNNYDVESDPVRVFTPTKPVKNVFDSSAPQVSIDGEIVKAGQELLYKVTYKNTTGKEQKVEIKDAIPEHTTYVEGSASDGGVHNNGVITWTKEKVAAGETFEVTFKVKVKDNVSGEIIKNKADVLEGNNKFETNETTNPTSTKPKKDVFDSSAPQVSIDGEIVKAGQELLYKVTYKNTTGKEQKVEIKDAIPEHTTYVEGSASDGGVHNNGVITWTKEKVAAGETFEVTFKVKVKDDVNGETIKNKANVLEGNNKFETNETTNPTSTKPKKDVFDSQDDIAPNQLFRDDRISIDGNEVKAGQELLYKVTYKNTTGKEQKVVIKDKIPEYTTYVEGSADNDGVYDNGVITWTKEKVAADETFEVTFKVKVKDDVNGGTIKNKANVLEGNNKFETNETTNPTSTKPKKDVFDSQDTQVSIDKQTVKAGQELLYKVTYKNTTGKEQKVVIKDKIPEYTTYVENSADNGGVYDNGVITWTKEKVAADETFEVTFKVKVKDDVNGETIKNKANVLEGNNEYETNETTNPTSTKPKKDVFDSQDTQVSIDKQTVKAGQELLYKVTYKNTTGKEQKVVIKDKIPEYTTYVDGSASDGGVYKDGEITWTKEKVAADETFEVTFKVKVKDDVNGETIKNKANVLEGNNKFETNETTNPTSTKPKKDVFDSQDTQVSIDKQTVKAGQELLYKVTYKNTTGKEQKVVIKDKIPEYTTYVDGSASDGGVYKDGEITWTKEKVAADETFEVTFKVKVKDDVNGETIKNKANVLEGNNKFETNETTNPTSTKPKKDVFDSQNDQVSIDGQIVKAGQELLYKVTYKNTTGKDQKVEIKDKIPEYTTYVDGSASDGGVYKDGEITWTKEKVAADETFEVTFKVKVKDDVSGEVIKNKANVLEGNNKFETNETTNPTSTKPKKDVFDSQNDQVSIDGQIVKAGQELLYKVTYKNTTGKDQKVEIKDKIPEYTTYVDGSASDGGVYKDGEITWTKEKVAADETFEVTFKVKVKDDVSGEIIKNKANVLEGNNKFETNETTNPTSTKPKKDVFDSQNDQVSIDGQIVKAGQELLYKVAYKNTTGKDQKVVIKDKIPEYTTYVDGSASDGGVYKDGEITWTKEKVAADETFEVTFKVKVKDDVNGETIKNKANVLEGNNKFETNETTNPTSTKPKKDVFETKDPEVSIDGKETRPGAELLYKVTYKNTTGKDQKVEIKDTIPEHTTYVEGSASDGGVYKDGVITWTKEKVAPGETFEVTFKVKVDENAGGNTVKNKANVLEGNNKFETNETTNPVSTKPVKDVFDSKNDKVSIDGKEVKAGQELLYKVTYKNTTGKDQKVEIKDKIPEYTTYVDGSASDGGVYKDGEITWTKEKVAADETFEVTFKVKVKDNVSGEVIKNKANVLEGNNKFETNETTNPTSTKPKKDVFDSQNDQVSIDGQIVKAGQELLYKVTYKNTTGKDQKVEIKDKIPEYTTYVDGSASDGGVYKDGEITWTKEKVAADETFEVTFKVKVKDDVSGEVIKNKANVLEGNNKFETNETTNPTSTKPKKDVFDSQNDQVSIDGQIVKAGQELLYKVTYKNTTGKDQKVEIKDKIPEYTTYVDGSASDGGVYKDGEITWTKEKVAADETFEVTFKVKVKDDVSGEVIKNKANVLEGNNNYETNETTNPTPKKPGKEIPRTGFGANTALYTALLGLSTVALGGFRIRYKKKNNK